MNLAVSLKGFNVGRRSSGKKSPMINDDIVVLLMFLVSLSPLSSLQNADLGR